MKICYFADQNLQHFDPLTLTRPVDQLRVGILTLSEKWDRTLDTQSPSTRSVRKALREVYPQPALEKSEDVMWINSRFLPQDNLIDKIDQLREQEAVTNASGKVLIAARLDGRHSAELIDQNEAPDLKNFNTTPHETYQQLNYLWDLFLLNGEEIRRDIKLLDPQRAPTETLPSDVNLSSPEQIYLEDDVTLEPGTIIIADEGPVFIGKGAKVMAGSVIRGPAAIGEESVVKMGAKIYEASTIGPVCKVAGEINNSIFHSYSNKGHEGFVGNSLIGQWCNLGADTNVSNLKNNYGEIDMRNWSTGETIESGQQFIGTIMGDHSKTAINTMLNTGTMCGVSCNIFASGFPPKIIPSFSWIGDSGRRVYRFDKAVETMKKMMSRRNVEASDAYISMMERLFEGSQK